MDLNDESASDEDAFHEHYRGEWDSEEAFAEEQICELGLGDIPAGKFNLDSPYGYSNEVDLIESILPYLDIELIARDLFFQHGNYTSVQSPDYKLYVFEQDV